MKSTSTNNLTSGAEKETLIEKIHSTQSFSNLDDIMPPQEFFPNVTVPDELQDSENFSFNKLYKIFPDNAFNSSKLNGTIDEETQVTSLKTDLLRTLAEITKD